MSEQICVLLATYNPKHYLSEQVDSILKQRDVDVEIIIRDDGSHDKTYLEPLRSHEKITIIEGDNLGVGKNIMTMIRYVCQHRKQIPYFAYSDQDDFWLDDKLITGIKKLTAFDHNKPSLYYSNLQVTDQNLKPTHLLFKPRVVKNTCGQSLAQVFSFACTSVFNFRMVEELARLDIEEMGFDSLIYYLAIFSGNIFYDETPHIYYRQHGDNLSGDHPTGFQKLKYRIHQIKHFKQMDAPLEYNAKYLLKHLQDTLTQEQVELLTLVADYRGGFKNKVKLLMNPKIKAGYYPKNMQCLLRILANVY